MNPICLVAEGGQLFFFQLKWILAVERDGAAGGRFKRADDVKQRALAAARWAHDRNRVAARKRERNVGDDLSGPLGVGYSLETFSTLSTKPPENQPRINADSREIRQIAVIVKHLRCKPRIALTAFRVTRIRGHHC